jgi:hypothetical protein
MPAFQWFQRVRIVRLAQPSRPLESDYQSAPQPRTGEVGVVVDFRDITDPSAPVVVEKTAAGGRLFWRAEFIPAELEPLDDE